MVKHLLIPDKKPAAYKGQFRRSKTNKKANIP